MKIAAYDIGGTFVKWAVLENGSIIEKGKYDTEAEKNQAIGILKGVSENTGRLRESYNDISAIAVSVPGVIDSKTGIMLSATHNIPNSQGMNIKEELQKLTGLRVSVINDANAATLGEMAKGTLKDVQTGVVVTLGTGIGGGIIVNGKIHQGHFYSAGEVGRHIVEGNTWERQFATKPLVESARKYLNVDHIRGEDLIEQSRHDAGLREIYEKWLDGVGQGLANIINIINPEAIALSGGITENEDFLIDVVREHVGKYVNPEILEATKINKTSSGNDAALFGAELFALEDQN